MDEGTYYACVTAKGDGKAKAAGNSPYKFEVDIDYFLSELNINYPTTHGTSFPKTWVQWIEDKTKGEYIAPDKNILDLQCYEFADGFICEEGDNNTLTYFNLNTRDVLML